MSQCFYSAKPTFAPNRSGNMREYLSGTLTRATDDMMYAHHDGWLWCVFAGWLLESGPYFFTRFCCLSTLHTLIYPLLHYLSAKLWSLFGGNIAAHSFFVFL